MHHSNLEPSNKLLNNRVPGPVQNNNQSNSVSSYSVQYSKLSIQSTSNQLSSEQSSTIKNFNAKERMRKIREKQTNEERDIQRMKDNKRKKYVKDSMTENELKELRHKNLESKQKSLENMTQNEQEMQLKKHALICKNYYQSKKSKLASIHEAMDSKNAQIYRLKNISENPPVYFVNCKHCGALHFIEERVQGKGDSFYDCCKHGQMEPIILNYPDELKIYFENKEFIKNIRNLNSSLAFASYATLRENENRPNDPLCYKIHGQVYHFMNMALEPKQGDIPTNGQLFFIDTEEALKHRINFGNENKAFDWNFNENISRTFEIYLREHNIFAKSYKMMKDYLDEEKNNAIISGIKPREMKLIFSTDIKGIKAIDKKLYDLPICNEIAAVFVCNADGTIPQATLVLHPNGDKKLINLSVLNPNTEPLCYPIFYPNGTHVWNTEMVDKKGKSISMRQYICSLMQDRNGYFNPILHAKQLFQQWLVDQYTKIESSDLDYIRRNQSKLKVENYSGLTDFLKEKSEKCGASVGRKIVLPSSFVNSPRYKMQKYQDSMAIEAKYGQGDLFITMTCNPRHPDILKCLKNGEQPHDRPDIVGRVFNLIVKQFIKDMTERKIFGKIISWIYVIEFQKRGLPHCHSIWTLAPEDREIFLQNIDKYLSAELPDKNDDNDLYMLVVQNMIHGPCGSNNPKAPCMKDNKCSKKFPKPFNEKTELKINGYAILRRRDDGLFTYKKSVKLDNRFVVPYSPYLLKRYLSHINAEKLISIKSIKYLYKYLYKGYDSAKLEFVITNKTGNDENEVIQHDEVKQYLDGRYISPIEAYWRIMSFDLHGRSHHVEPLVVHLNEKQNITFPSNATNDQLKKALIKDSKLLAYFKLNKTDKNAQSLKYIDIPTKYTWNNKECKWILRKNYFNTIGRMYTVSPNNLELYHFRLLLLHVTGATSHEDLYKVENDDGTFIICNTYMEACMARGLIKDDEEYIHCIEEAVKYKFPNELRNLFARILIHCGLVKPNDIWDRFKDDFCEDLIKKFEKNKDIAYKFGLALIEYKMNDVNKSLKDFPDIEFDEKFDLALKKNEIDKKVEFEKYEKLYGDATEEQKCILNIIKECLDEIKDDNELVPKCYFIEGEGGSGKTYTYKAMSSLIKSMGKTVCTMAYSGIASIILPKGRTIHNRFKFELNVTAESIPSITANSKEAEELINTDVFIWDEAPTSVRFLLDNIDDFLKTLMKNNKPFGGKIIVLGGDFTQTGPIQERATRSEIVNLSIKFAKAWKYFKLFKLTKNIRAAGDPKFAEDLRNIGKGLINDENDEYEVPKNCICYGDLEEEIFGDIIENDNWDELAHRAILAPYNYQVNEINKKVLQKYKSQSKIYPSIDKTDKNGEDIQEEYLNSLEPTNLPPHKLELKLNCVVILLRNLNVNEGLVNGTRFQIIELGNHVLKCKILTGDRNNECVFIPRITLLDDKSYYFPLYRHQFPVKLAFSMTSNKSQGQTLKKIGANLEMPCFAHGQFCVICGRVRSWNDIKFKLPNGLTKTKNIVYKELLI